MDMVCAALRGAGMNESQLTLAFRTNEEAVYRVQVPGLLATGIWQRLRNEVDRTGYWPVILGDEEDLDLLVETVHDYAFQATSEVLHDADLIMPEQWMDFRREEFLLETPESSADDARWMNQDFQEAVSSGGSPRGAWPEGISPRTRYQVTDHCETGEPLAMVHLGMIPVRESWKVPALLKFGGWGECPLPAEHVALLRYWEGKYQTEVVGVTRNALELKVVKSPKSREESLALAEQHFHYNRSIVLQGAGTIDALAASLLGGSVWRFQWD